MPPQEVTQAYHKLVTLFDQNLSRAKNISAPSANKGPSADSMTVVTQDLLLLILPYLSSEDATALLDLYLTTEVLESRDNGVQKRGYKTLARLVESGKTQLDAAAVFKTLESLVDGLAAAAKKDRFHLLTAVVRLIPSESLHLIPSVIPEAVLGTKEPSEKARNAAFDLIVAMGKKMSAGGVVKRDQVEGMEEDDAPVDGMWDNARSLNFTDLTSPATANIEEYMTMIAGGLAGASPHMISATVTTISRLVFEFRGSYMHLYYCHNFRSLSFRVHLVGDADGDLRHHPRPRRLREPRDRKIRARVCQARDPHAARRAPAAAPEGHRSYTPAVVARPQEPLQGEGSAHLRAPAEALRVGGCIRVCARGGGARCTCEYQEAQGQGEEEARERASRGRRCECSLCPPVWLFLTFL